MRGAVGGKNRLILVNARCTIHDSGWAMPGACAMVNPMTGYGGKNGKKKGRLD